MHYSSKLSKFKFTIDNKRNPVVFYGGEKRDWNGANKSTDYRFCWVEKIISSVVVVISQSITISIHNRIPAKLRMQPD